MLEIVVCVSGGGTNLQALIDAVENGTVTNTKIVGVISNNHGAKALESAKNHGIPAICISPKDYENRSLFNEALLAQIQNWNPGLVVLAGFLVAIPEAMVKAYPNRIINIHPSLIPSFCGVGYYGLKVHEAALAKALFEDRIGGLGVDVYSAEPMAEDHPFQAILDRPNVCFTPHMAWGGFETRTRLMEEIAQNIESFLQGERRCRVD